MWDYLPVRSLLDRQRAAAIERVDEMIVREWADGYGVDVDRLLDYRWELMRLIEELG